MADPRAHGLLTLSFGDCRVVEYSLGMNNSTRDIQVPLYIVQRIISLLGNPDRNNHECLEEAQALRRTLEQIGR